MKYLLDTSAVVNHLRGKRSLRPLVVKESSAISIITQAELFYGAHKSVQPQNSLRKIKQMLKDLGIEIISLDEKILQAYGKTKAKLEKKGQKLDEFDLLIAATCLAHNLTLVTSNPKHFKRVPRLRCVE